MLTVFFLFPFLLAYFIWVFYTDNKIIAFKQKRLWTTGNSWKTLWLFGRALTFKEIQIGIRWAFAKLHLSQLMSLSWKYLTPVSLPLIMLCGTLNVLIS